VYSIILAYLLWFISGFGALGLHRFYLGKIGTGLLWLFTGGLGMLGGIYDFFALPSMVRETNLRLEMQDRGFVDDNYSRRGDARGGYPRGGDISVGYRSAKSISGSAESVEKTVLRIAKENAGLVSASEVALAGNVDLDQARSLMERLAAKGFCEMRIRKSGTIVYCFPDFMDDSEFEDL
jgi:TM2 domain-containing membrane protein YozV